MASNQARATYGLPKTPARESANPFTSDFDQIADGLYGLPPGEFTRARNASADEAKKAGEPELARRIRELHRPTLGAWGANLLVHQHREETARLLDLGAGLRRAQADLDSGDLRDLSARRRQIVTALVDRVRRTAEDAGQPLGQGPLGEVEQTLRAVLADQGAADRFARGRLTAAITPATALPPTTAPPAGATTGSTDPAPARAPGDRKQPRDDRGNPAAQAREHEAEAARRRRDEAREQAETAERDERAAVAAMDRIEKDLGRAAAQREKLEAEAEQKAAELERSRSGLVRARRAEAKERARFEEAEERAGQARQRARKAARRLRDLTARMV